MPVFIFCMSVCLPLLLSISLSLFMYVYGWVCLSLFCLFLRLFVCVSVWMSLSNRRHLVSVYSFYLCLVFLSFHIRMAVSSLSVPPSVWVPVFFSHCLNVSLSVYLFITFSLVVHVPRHTPVSLFLCPSVHFPLFICPLIPLFCVFFFLTFYLRVYIPAPLSVYTI